MRDTPRVFDATGTVRWVGRFRSRGSPTPTGEGRLDDVLGGQWAVVHSVPRWRHAGRRPASRRSGSSTHARPLAADRRKR